MNGNLLLIVKKELTKSSRSYLCQGLALFVL